VVLVVVVLVVVLVLLLLIHFVDSFCFRFSVVASF